MYQVNDLSKEKQDNPSTIKTTLVILLLIGGIILSMWYVVSMMNQAEEQNFVNMPDINGLTFAQARDVLEPLGLHLSNSVRYQLTDDVDFGRIISFTPQLGSEVEVGSSVNVWISDGKYTVVEDYQGMKIEDVQQELAGSRITIRIEKEQSNDIPPGTVIRQEQLLPGDKIDPRVSREIKLVVSTYVEIVIPPILGMDVEEAASQLRDLGVTVTLVQQSTEAFDEEELEQIVFGVVTQVSPNVGSLYSQFENNSITLYYY